MKIKNEPRGPKNKVLLPSLEGPAVNMSHLPYAFLSPVENALITLKKK